MRKIALLLLMLFGVVFGVSAQDTRSNETRTQQKLNPENTNSETENKKKGRQKLWKKQRKWKPPHRQSWTWNAFRQGYRSIGGGINSMNYFGDITPLQDLYATDIRFTQGSFSLFYLKRHRPMYTSRLMFTYGRVRGTDTPATESKSLKMRTHIDNQFRYVRNLHFMNNIYELSYSGIVNLGAHRELFYNRPDKILPYLTFGVAVYYHNPKAQTPDEFGKEWVSLQTLRTEGQGWVNPNDGTNVWAYSDVESANAADTRMVYNKRPYSRVQVAIPLGMGFTKRIGQRWDLSFEMSMRFLLTDYLDDVSGNFPDPGVFTQLYDQGVYESEYQMQLAQAMSDRSYENARKPDVLSPHIVQAKHYLSPMDNNIYTTYLGKFSYDYNNNRGNVNDKDTYMVAGLHLAYILPGQVRCPEPFKKRHRNPWHWHRGAAR